MLRLLPILLVMIVLQANKVRADDAPTPATAPASAPATSPTTTASYAGTFSDNRLTVVLGVAPPEKAKQGEYVGTFTLDGKTYDATASVKGNGIAGTFRVGGNPFQFSASYEGAGLVLQSADATYHLKNITPPAVPATMPAATPTTGPAGTQPSTKEARGS